MTPVGERLTSYGMAATIGAVGALTAISLGFGIAVVADEIIRHQSARAALKDSIEQGEPGTGAQTGIRPGSTSITVTSQPG